MHRLPHIPDAKEETNVPLRHVQSELSTLSAYDVSFRNDRSAHSDPKLRERSRDRRLDPLGLTVLYEPEGPPVADIIFVHGLGGTSRQTWSKNRDPTLFWPGEWLPQERNTRDARITSFGYNAHFASTSSKDNILTISDFAKDLLFKMRFATGSAERGLNMGTVPIIFVAHSMGGLVVKKAYILGQHDLHYKDIVNSMTSIVFLSTPHRGTNLAETLNRVLSACVFTLSPKQYVSELKSNSLTLQEINEQFRNLAKNLNIVSFYETLQTTVGPSKTMILQKDSSSLGYPDEISEPLNADHHDVCKFTSPEDPNYISVRDILQHLVARARTVIPPVADTDASEELLRIAESFGDLHDATVDLDHFTEQRMDGSCQWVIDEPFFQGLINDTVQAPRFLWCTGKPGAGKSVLTSFIINHLRGHGLHCAYFFFRFGSHNNNNLNVLIMSIASQIASFMPEYRRRLLQMIEEGLNFQRSAPRLLWQRLITSGLLKSKIEQALYLVVDALDECETSPLLLRLFTDVAGSHTPLRILVVSRKTQQLSGAFERFPKTLPVSMFSLDTHQKDLRLFVTEEMSSMRGDPIYRQQVASRVLERAAGNFLWVYLVVKEILRCHTEDAIEEALSEVPEDLELLYERMDKTLSSQTRTADQAMGRTILRWIACSMQPLSLGQLAEALKPEYPRVLDLRLTISQVCGEFVVVDNLGHLAIVHSTAREVLTRDTDLHFHIPVVESHVQIFAKCLTLLSGLTTRAFVDQVDAQSFLVYAATYWPRHLEYSHALSDQSSLLLLAKLFRTGSVLSWIYILAVTRHLRVVVDASKALTHFLKRIDRLDAERNHLSHKLQEKELLTLWATDLVRLIGKFGANLLEHPKLIFKLVAPFCPRNSILFRQFAPKSALPTLAVSGISNSSWDDCLARFAVSGQSLPTKIICASRYFAILKADGVLILYHAATHEEARRMKHGERVLAWCFSARGDKLATYGLRRTCVWSTVTAEQLRAISNPAKSKALAIAFAADDESVLTCSDDRVVRSCSLLGGEEGWLRVEDVLGQDTYGGKQYNSPRQAVFNPEGTQLAVAYRGLPLSAWAVDEPRPRLIGMCQSIGDRERLDTNEHNSYTTAKQMTWNPMTGHILGIYDDGRVFKWHPLDDDLQESSISATNIKCSADGKFFVTCTGGALRVWDFHHFTTVYQLSSGTSVADLAIDAEESRIYDLRDNFCSIWEPNALVRLWDTDEKASETQSTRESSTQVSMFSEASAEMLEPISALALSQTDAYYATGNEEGVVELYSAEGDCLSELCRSFMTVEHICWSSNGSHVASADLSRRIVVKKIERSTPKAFAISVHSAKEQTSIKQILLSPEADFLLVATERFINVWSLPNGAIVLTHPVTVPTKWLCHPTDRNVLVGVSFTTIHLCRWDAIDSLSSIPLDRTAIDSAQGHEPHESLRRKHSASYPMSPSESEYLVDLVLVTEDNETLLIETSQSVEQGRRRKDFMLISMASIREAGEGRTVNTTTAVAKPLPSDLLSWIEMPLGFVATDPIQAARRKSSLRNTSGGVSPGLSPTGESILAFLSRDFWVCTYTIGEGRAGRVKRHFFVPRDWLVMDMLELAVMRSDGTFLCPRNGEVAIVKNALKEEWID